MVYGVCPSVPTYPAHGVVREECPTRTTEAGTILRVLTHDHMLTQIRPTGTDRGAYLAAMAGYGCSLLDHACERSFVLVGLSFAARTSRSSCAWTHAWMCSYHVGKTAPLSWIHSLRSVRFA